MWLKPSNQFFDMTHIFNSQDECLADLSCLIEILTPECKYIESPEFVRVDFCTGTACRAGSHDLVIEHDKHKNLLGCCDGHYARNWNPAKLGIIIIIQCYKRLDVLLL
eukprot:m.50586 g.50586  ORF g.50586 m.50586 type:complete len:108 (-) comp21315_c0_seq3:394-717(-)